MSDDNRRAVFGWAMYDWANSAFATTVMAAFFPIFFKQFWSTGADAVLSTAKLGLANSMAGIAVALCAPVLGAIADRGQVRKRFMICFAFAGAAATASLGLIGQGEWHQAAALYIVAMIGFAGGNIFYDSLITAVATEKRLDAVSALGFSLGYLGGGLLFALNVGMTLRPGFFGLESAAAAVRFSFLSVGIWWILFSFPLILFVREPAGRGQEKIGGIVAAGLRQLLQTFREIRHHRTIVTFLAAYWLYIDGVNTIIVMALDYGLSIGFASQDLILALLMTQFIGFPAALAFGRLGGLIGTKRAILAGIAIYLAMPLWGFFMQSKVEFFLMAGFIGLVQGGVQALSRSFFARIIPPDKAAEYFGFYNMVGKFAAVVGPVLIGGVALWARSAGFGGDLPSRLSILSISFLFLAGGGLLLLVDEQRGRQEARYLMEGEK
ncbi:MAG: MFS transporter [Proteobacteria bacterium]|nr:MFS transporter [Pseudomonadota bacterium]